VYHLDTISFSAVTIITYSFGIFKHSLLLIFYTLNEKLITQSKVQLIIISGTSFGLVQIPSALTARTASPLGNVIGSLPTGANLLNSFCPCQCCFHLPFAPAAFPEETAGYMQIQTAETPVLSHYNLSELHFYRLPVWNNMA